MFHRPGLGLLLPAVLCLSLLLPAASGAAEAPASEASSGQLRDRLAARLAAESPDETRVS